MKQKPRISNSLTLDPFALAEARNKRDLTQDELAQAVDAVRSTISRAEGSGKIGRKMAKRVAAILGVTVQDLLPKPIAPEVSVDDRQEIDANEISGAKKRRR